jgi:hypothetical protein
MGAAKEVGHLGVWQEPKPAAGSASEAFKLSTARKRYATNFASIQQLLTFRGLPERDCVFSLVRKLPTMMDFLS